MRNKVYEVDLGFFTRFAIRNILDVI